jgi:CheY-like chemotaxis protein
MKTHNKIKPDKSSRQTFNHSILVLDDDKNVRDMIIFYGQQNGFKNITVVANVDEAIQKAETNDYDIFSFDFNMPGQKLKGKSLDGIGLFKYLYNETSIKKRIIYTALTENKIEEISVEKKQWCDKEGITIVTKSTHHESLFNVIREILQVPSHLPNNPVYANLNDGELLLSMANDLLVELRKNETGYFSFGSGTEPIKNAKLINEIEKLTPLGKEILGNWFKGVKRHLEYLNRQRLKK